MERLFSTIILSDSHLEAFIHLDCKLVCSFVCVEDVESFAVEDAHSFIQVVGKHLDVVILRGKDTVRFIDEPDDKYMHSDQGNQ